MIEKSLSAGITDSGNYRTWKHLCLVVGLVGSLFYLHSQLFLAGQFVSEDSFYFYATAYNQPLLEAIATPYAGYLHVFPMLLAEILWLLPFEVLPWVNSIVVLTLNICLLSWFYSPYCRCLVASDGLRMSIVILLAVTPFQPNLGMLLGLHWYFAFFLGIFLISDLPNSRRCVIPASVFVTLAAWSSPGAVVIIPLALYRWWQERRSRCRYIPFSFAVASLAYLAAIVLIYKPTSSQPGLADPSTAIKATLLMLSEGVIFQSFLGVHIAELLPLGIAWVFNALVVGGVAGALWLLRNTPRAKIASVLIMLGVAMLGLTMLRGHQSQLLLQGDDLSLHERYLTTPVFYFWTAVGILIAPWVSALFRRGRLPRMAIRAGWMSLLLAMLWGAPPLEGERPLSEAFPHPAKAATLKAFEQRYESGGQPETLALPGWTPIECMRLKVGGGRTCQKPEDLSCIFGTDLHRIAEDAYRVHWLGNFTVIDPDWVDHERWGKIAIIGYSGGFYWFREPRGQIWLSGPAIYPERFEFPLKGFTRIENN